MHTHLTDSGDPMSAFEAELSTLDIKPRHDGGVERIWRMTPAERVAAMRAGELSLRQLTAWSARCPHEVPLIGGEFEWIVATTPEWADAPDRDREAQAER